MLSPSLQRLYRELYHKLKDKIHTTPDTPEIRQVKKTQEAVSEVRVWGAERPSVQGAMLALCSLTLLCSPLPPPALVDLQIRLLQDAGTHDLAAIHTPSVALSLRGRHHQ